MRCRMIAVAIFIALFGATSCSLIVHPDPFPTGKCAPPCWQNLTPGKSTNADVNALIDGLTARQRQALRDRVPDIACRSVAWPIDSFENEVWLQDDLVRVIDIGPNFLLPMRQVVDRFGSPEYLQADLVNGPDGSVYSVYAFYPAKGVMFELRPDVKYAGQIRPDDDVIRMQYTPVNDLAMQLLWPDTCARLSQDAVAHRVQARMTALQPWKGFGEVDLRTSP